MNQESRHSLAERSGSRSLMRCNQNVDYGCGLTRQVLTSKLTLMAAGRVQFLGGVWTEGLGSLLALD